MLKVTTVNNKIGLESCPFSVEVNDAGYVLLPELPDTDHGYYLYAPLVGFEEEGPWYFKRYISRREAKQARRTVVGLYDQQDLCPQMSPQEMMTISFPPSFPGQELWKLYINESPVAIVSTANSGYEYH